MGEDEKARRTGGRSARVRAAVHQAVAELVAERGHGAFTVGDVAARAGVADTSIYRRWGDLDALVADVAITRLTADSPMPDTGTLRGDLRAYAEGVARDVSGPAGLAVLRLVVALSTTNVQARDEFVAGRGRQFEEMLQRARDRGEAAPEAIDVVDHILAPLYVRALFGIGALTPEAAGELADRLVDQSQI
ncbi:TetR/AcrR family transcriptional regulator [Dactylosporangium sp. NPDC000244]|uniref:TetR/AcrR family transcriptional regulator n=1 Tax=Dactylosporangium sp. NPDC000244 TaxID=3154365 RepID=UPI003328F464